MLKLLTLALLAQGFTPIPGLTLREQASFLLLEPPVRQSLALSPTEKARLDAASKAYDEARDKLPAAASDADVAALDHRFAVDAVWGLAESRRQKLFLRAIRMRGVAAMADREVAAKVGLKGAALARVQSMVQSMDRRDGDIPEELAKISIQEATGERPDTADANEARRTARLKAAEPRIKARAAARKREEAALLASLPASVRLAWKKLVG